MDPETFNAAQPLLDKIAELAGKQLDSVQLRRLIAELSNLVGKRKIASVNIVVDVFDEDRECSLPLLTTGLSAFSGKEPFRSGATRHRRGTSLRQESRWFRMIAARTAGRSGISSYRIHPVRTVASRWVTNANCFWTATNALGATKEK